MIIDLGEAMSKYELLNNIDHKDVRVVTTRSAEYGDDLWYTPTFWREFRSIQSCYPILFQKDSEGDSYVPLAFFGFQQGENLFLNNGGWDAHYVPLSVQRMPFYIGFQPNPEGGDPGEQRVITIDMASPRVSRNDGVSLFLEYGGNSEYLEKIADILETLHHGAQENQAFVKALQDNDLLEPVTIDVKLVDGNQGQMIGFHTINEDKLKDLSDDKVLEFHRNGYLQAIYCAVVSQVKFGDLVRRKNEILSRENRL